MNVDLELLRYGSEANYPFHPGREPSEEDETTDL